MLLTIVFVDILLCLPGTLVSWLGTFDPLLGQAILIYYFINFDLYVFHMIILM